jgi:hypothetical protein
LGIRNKTFIIDSNTNDDLDSLTSAHQLAKEMRQKHHGRHNQKVATNHQECEQAPTQKDLNTDGVLHSLSSAHQLAKKLRQKHQSKHNQQVVTNFEQYEQTGEQKDSCIGKIRKGKIVKKLRKIWKQFQRNYSKCTEMQVLAVL